MGSTASTGGSVEWELDRSLLARMVATMVFLAVLPVGFVYALQFALNRVVVPLVGGLAETPIPVELSIPLWLVAVATIAGFALQYAIGDRIALDAAGARRADAESDPDLLARVRRLSAQAGVPAPRVAVSDSDVPNAFTIGRRPGAATIVLTEGLRKTLDVAQLDAVLAHELAHVKNRDVAVMSLAYVLPTLTYVVAVAAYHFLRWVLYALAHVDLDDSDDAKALLVVVAVLVVSSLVTITVATLFWIASYLLFRLLSQYREFAADRGAAAITGDPTALATALEDLDDEMSSLPDEDLREKDGGLEALYVAPIDTYQFEGKRDLISSDVFPQTHPPTEDRVEQLRAMTAEVES